MNSMNDKVPMEAPFAGLLDEAPKKPAIKITIPEFLAAYRARLRTMLLTLAAALLATLIVVVIFLHASSKTNYTAVMTVAPNFMVSAGSSGGGTGGGLSALIGLQAPTDARFELYLSTRKSNGLAERLMAVPGLPQRLFAGWDEERHAWAPPPGIMLAFRRSLTRALGFEPWAPPTAGDMLTYLQESMTVITDKRTLITKIMYSNGDKEFAKQFLKIVHNETENILRLQAQERTRIMINHILHELGTVTVTEQREALILLLSEQEKQMIMIGKELPFAAVQVDAPAADVPDGKPRPLLTVLVSLFLVTLGVIVGFGGWTLLNLRRAKRAAEAAKGV